MRFVIFDDDTSEPITVINLPGIGERDIWERMGGRVLLAIPPRLGVAIKAASEPPSALRMETVELRFERFVRRDQTSLMCFTREAELAMLLDPDFLPGQRKVVRELQTQNDRLSALLLRAITQQ